ncbi:MAG: DUF86 domain-containing protein [Firmicutes bacterium]|nr:DUF86 domain-containing protein [Bacillota bacterium]
MRNEIIIQKIIGYAEKVLRYCEDVSSQSEFSANSMLVESCVFNLSQIGEIANKLDNSFTDQYPEIPWRALYALRNRIVHDYEGVNLTLVWDIVHDDLPGLVIQLKELQSSFPYFAVDTSGYVFDGEEANER